MRSRSRYIDRDRFEIKRIRSWLKFDLSVPNSKNDGRRRQNEVNTKEEENSESTARGMNAAYHCEEGRKRRRKEVGWSWAHCMLGSSPTRVLHIVCVCDLEDSRLLLQFRLLPSSQLSKGISIGAECRFEFRIGKIGLLLRCIHSGGHACFQLCESETLAVG